MYPLKIDNKQQMELMQTESISFEYEIMIDTLYSQYRPPNYNVVDFAPSPRFSFASVLASSESESDPCREQVRPKAFNIQPPTKFQNLIPSPSQPCSAACRYRPFRLSIIPLHKSLSPTTFIAAGGTKPVQNATPA